MTRGWGDALWLCGSIAAMGLMLSFAATLLVGFGALLAGSPLGDSALAVNPALGWLTVGRSLVGAWALAWIAAAALVLRERSRADEACPRVW